jgi:hypothetical protein
MRRSGSIGNSVPAIRAVGGLHPGNFAVAYIDTGNFDASPERRALLGRACHEAGHDAVRVDEAVGGAEGATDNVVGPQLGEHFADVVGLKPLNALQSERLLPGEVGPQIIYVRLGGRHEQVAVRLVSGRVAGGLLKPVQEGDGVQRHLDIDVGGELRAHAAHALAGRPEALACLALDHEHVLHPSLGEMKGDAGTNDARAYDDDVGRRRHEVLILPDHERDVSSPLSTDQYLGLSNRVSTQDLEQPPLD